MNLVSCFSSDLIHCTNEMNVNIPQLADSLFERTTNTSWVVVFKSLITTHHLMVYGNEVRHTISLSSNNTTNKCIADDLISWLCLSIFPPPHAAFCPVLGFKEYTIQPQQFFGQKWVTRYHYFILLFQLFC